MNANKISAIKIQVTLRSAFRDDRLVNVNLSNEALYEVINSFKCNHLEMGPTVEDLYRIIYEDMKEQGYNLGDYFIHDIKLLD
jgi:hypothetical protein